MTRAAALDVGDKLKCVSRKKFLQKTKVQISKFYAILISSLGFRDEPYDVYIKICRNRRISLTYLLVHRISMRICITCEHLLPPWGHPERTRKTDHPFKVELQPGLGETRSSLSSFAGKVQWSNARLFFFFFFFCERENALA